MTVCSEKPASRNSIWRSQTISTLNRLRAIMSVMLSVALLLAAQPLAKLEPVPFTQVTIKDKFWAPRRETNRKVSLTHSLDMLEKAGNIEDFELAAAGKRTGYKGPVFMDSDLYKTLEAVSYSLATDPDPALEKRIDGMIAKIAAAQMPDGYVNTWYQVNEPDRRFTNLADNHELYCAGHMFEAAVAHYRATGKKTFLNVATKYADLLARTFGDKPGQRAGYCGHPEVELALVKLWKATGNQEYFRLAKFFIDHRGEHFFAKEKNIPDAQYDGTYWQDNVPIREHKSIVGHAVRAAYLMSGVVDVARETDDQSLLTMVDRVWKNTTRKNMYVTGGIGPSASNEGFTEDYDLPNLSAYQETCASVAMAMWNYRLALLYGDAKYADVMETSLYNGILSGYSLDGKRYFYVNPLASRGNHHRSEWFGCACCPPNEARTLAQLGGYAYATSPTGLYVNLFIAGSVNTTVNGTQLKVDVTTDYPWDGKVKFTLHPAKTVRFGFYTRIPSWCPLPGMKANGALVAYPSSGGPGYLGAEREWKDGDTFELDLKLEPRRVAANPNVKENVGRLALARGPIIYCLEQADNAVDLNQLFIPAEAQWSVSRSNELGGIVAMESEGRLTGGDTWPGGLYASVNTFKPVKLRAIPYYAWDNRKAGQMVVWTPTSPPPPRSGGLELGAKVEMSYVNWNTQPQGINDGVEPKSSGEQPASLAHWWDHLGTKEWVSYSWPSKQTVSRIQVYWFDDTGRGACRIPQDWHVEAKVDGQWKPIRAEYPVQKDSWCNVSFDPVTTDGLRIVVQMKKDFAAGIHEWRVWGPED